MTNVADMRAALAVADLGKAEFAMLSGLVYRHSGIHLGEQKVTLMRSRLARRLRALGLNSFKEYCELLARERGPGEELVHLLDEISTNLTEFFREPASFVYLREHFFKRWQGEPCIRILSAGCSTGEEPYSVAICAQETLGAGAGRVQIAAVDISSRVIAAARRAIYSREQIAALPPERVRTFFLRGVGSSEGMVRVAPEIRGRVAFQRANLTSETRISGSPFHAILCRNVSIYFDAQTRQAMFERFHRDLLPGGTLILGHSESLLAHGRLFAYVQPAIYERR